MWYQSCEYVVTYRFNPHFPYYWWGCVLSCLDHFDLYFICISFFMVCLLKSFSFSNWNTYLCRVLCSMSVLSVYIVNIFPFDVLEFLFGWNSLGCTHLSFMVSGIFKVYLFIYLSVYFGKCNERKRETGLPSADALPKWLEWPGLDQTGARSFILSLLSARTQALLLLSQAQ